MNLRRSWRPFCSESWTILTADFKKVTRSDTDASLICPPLPMLGNTLCNLSTSHDEAPSLHNPNQPTIPNFSLYPNAAVHATEERVSLGRAFGLWGVMDGWIRGRSVLALGCLICLFVTLRTVVALFIFYGIVAWLMIRSTAVLATHLFSGEQ